MAERKWPGAIKKLFKALGDAEQAGELVGLWYDHAVDEPVARYIDPDRLLAQVERALAEPLVESWARDHLEPFLHREHERAKERGDLVGDWLTAEAKMELRSLAARPVEFDKRFLEKLVQQGAVKHMLKSVIEETLNRFVETLRPGGSGGGVGGSVARSAFGFAKRAAGGGVLGAIGEQVQQQASRAARTFIDGSMNMMLERLVVIMSSPETARQLGRTKLQVYEEAMKTPTAKVTKYQTKVPMDDLLEVIPGVISYNLERPEIRDGILAEVRAALEVEGARSLREILGDDDIAALRAEVIELGGPLLADLAGSAPFLDWLHPRVK